MGTLLKPLMAALSTGDRLGVYEIGSPLGAGGMGEVYRAKDTKLGRNVALKILPFSFTNDPERVARFRREAQVLASLNHAHIAQIYGLEEANGTQFLVLELVEGESLDKRIAGGPIPIEEALGIAKQIAEALEAAHEKGIIHRDLKPANIALTPDGAVKVLDFGLAKAVETTSGSANAMNSPTITSPLMTSVGVILGTAAYMSPEQARGKAADKRADIWAFGCVLYEMLTGRRAFSSDEVSDTLAFIITKDVDWAELPETTSPGVRRVLRRCLEKDLKRRLRDIADARLELDDPPDASSSTGDDSRTTLAFQRSSRRWRAVALGSAVVLLSLITTIWVLMRRPQSEHRAVQRFPIAVPESAPYVGGELALSPDGNVLVYVGVESGKSQLYQRRLDRLDAQPIRGTDNAANPFFSPDGEWVGFFTGGSPDAFLLRKVSLRGGPPLTLAETSLPMGGTWSADNAIIFTRTVGFGWGLFKTPAGGGTPTTLLAPDMSKQEFRYGFPEMLPGGKALLFSVAVRNGFDTAHIAVMSLETGAYHTVVEQGYHARYASGYLIYMLSDTLMAVPFDTTRLRATGPPVSIVQGVRGRIATGDAGFAASSTGFLVYAPGTTALTSGRRLVWVDRSGREEPIGAPARSYQYPRLSPDGSRVALDIRDEENDIWIWNLARQNLTRVTFNPGTDGFPVWAPDGERLFFTSVGFDNIARLFTQAADGSGRAERLLQSPNSQAPMGISPDGKYLLIRDVNSKTAADIAMLSLADRHLTTLVQTPFEEQNPDVSPDGRWMAYESNESGTTQIYVRPFPDVDQGRWQVSTTGGTQPVWSRSGRELFYVTGGRLQRGHGGTLRMMVVPTQTGTAFSSGNPKVLFAGPYAPTGAVGRTYDVSADGQRFLMIKAPVDTPASSDPPFVAVLNWTEDLKARVPVK
jgi:serine/threonine-protein kinase